MLHCVCCGEPAREGRRFCADCENGEAWVSQHEVSGDVKVTCYRHRRCRIMSLPMLERLHHGGAKCVTSSSTDSSTPPT
jgi:hypothetical protein